MAIVPPKGTFHYWGLGIKDASLDDDAYAACSVFCRGEDFEDGNEIGTETDSGHTGTASLDMGSYRTSAESAPSWTDNFRYSEGLEDIVYLLLGHVTTTPYSDGTSTVDGVYQHVFNPSQNTNAELPFATIYNGFGKTMPNYPYDGRVWNNAMLNEFEVNFSSADVPTYSPTFISDYNNVNMVNPVKTYGKNNFAKANHSKVYLGDLNVTEANMIANQSVDCFDEASFTVNMNAESQSCHDDEFGKNTKIMGEREITGSITMPWHDGTKYLETEFEAYNKYGHIVSEEITHKQIWFVCNGGSIIYENQGTSTDTGVPFQTWFKFPVCEITKVSSPKSGEDAKNITLEFKALEKSNTDYMTAKIITDLAELHIDNTGVAFDTLRPNVAPFPVSSP